MECRLQNLSKRISSDFDSENLSLKLVKAEEDLIIAGQIGEALIDENEAFRSTLAELSAQKEAIQSKLTSVKQRVNSLQYSLHEQSKVCFFIFLKIYIYLYIFI